MSKLRAKTETILKYRGKYSLSSCHSTSGKKSELSRRKIFIAYFKQQGNSMETFLEAIGYDQMNSTASLKTK